MNRVNDLIVGFNQQDSNKVKSLLLRLIPYLEENKYILVGGIAIRYHLISKGVPYNIRPFNDLDVIAKEENTLNPKVTQDFLISHYHPAKNSEPYIALVDPFTKTKVDIFGYDPVPEETFNIDFEGYTVKIPSSEDQLVKTVLDVQRISEKAKVDPKQFEDARLLMKVSDLKVAIRIWKRKYFARFRTNLIETLEKAEKRRSQHPEWVVKNPFRKPEPYICKECVDANKFPLTPMDKIYKILDYDISHR